MNKRYSPRLGGIALRAVAAVANTKAGALATKASFVKDLGLDELAGLPDAWRGPMPLDANALQARPPRADGAHDAKFESPRAEGWPPTSRHYARAYATGAASPDDVARRAFAAIDDLARLSPSMSPLLEGTADEARALEDAAASAARHRAGAPLGPLDGVPVLVKEQVAVRGLPRQLGTTVVPRVALEADATVVTRLREAGAIVLGLSMMTEYGMNPLGVNPKRRMPRNPHALGHTAGGSSTGSGVGVAVGLCPIALAADGGGSIRIPAAWSGVFGIKPTFGRVSREGDGFGGTVNHLGPIGSSAEDLALFLEATAGFDPLDPVTRPAPEFEKGSLVRALGRGVRGLRVGVIESEWEDATPEIARAGLEALRALEREGAVLVASRLPLARHAAPIGYLTIGMESYAETREARTRRWSELGADLRSSYGTLASFSAGEHADAMRLRSGLRLQVRALFDDIDLLGLPTTARTAPAVTDDEMREGMIDSGALDSACRFAFIGNLTGYPASTSPIGEGAHGLPLALQLLGDAFDEATVLAATAHLERIGSARAKKPLVSVDLLG